MTSEKTGVGTGGAVAAASVAPVALGAAAVVAIFVGAGWYLLGDGSDPAPVTASVPVAPTTATVAPAAGSGAAPAAGTSPATVPVAVPQSAAPAKAPAALPDNAPSEPAADPAVPRFDNWRVALDGEAVVAGRALAGADIAVVVDGKDVAQTKAGGDGSFAALFTLPPNPQPSLMHLEARADGKIWRSAQDIALAPIAGKSEAAAEAAAAVASAPAALLLTEQGVEVQAPQPAAVAPSASVPSQPATAPQSTSGIAAAVLDAIAYAPNGDVQLSGKGAAGQTMRIYLDGGVVGEAPVSMAGQWHAVLGDVEPGLYTLRLDQLDAAGKVTARFETPFKRDTAEALAALIAPSPQTGAQTGTQNATAPQVAAAPVAGQSVGSSDPAATPAVDAEPRVASPAAPLAPAVVEQVTITVQPGYTLWGIARETFGDGVLYVQVYEANRDKIRNPDLIYPGQVFSLPTGQ